MLGLLRNISRPRRAFHWAVPRRTVQDKQPLIDAFRQTTLFQKLAGHPEAVYALEDFAKLMQAKGLDFSSGKPPSPLQMLKLASNSEFRESAKRVGEELQKAGVDMQSKELMQEMMELMKLKQSDRST
ncbi:hypothetical protein Agabi119p4_4788 [Agaricus bisporus var. burnettii]|uniref:Uncharacterized protein n=1 Tax=Agaricus bisporus var. burnettii TaxID=192524 RepID=A0A8H7F437_AGABI|nr:hypothetical protein Agabi119p4_4788 [Agaricus bisporus var. burnettii]